MSNFLARRHGIPKWLRQYATRYGPFKQASVEGIIQTHRKNRVPMLDHGRDRGIALRNAVAAAQRIGA